MDKIRVLVVEDSPTVRHRLREVLASDPDLLVVGEAEDGRQAIELCRELRPSVVTLDMMLPVMSGLAATEYIMAYFPTPILVVSSSLNRGELFKTYEALAAGAVDVLDKPRGNEPDGAWEKRLLSSVKLVSRIRVITHPRGRLAGMTGSGPAPRTAALPRGTRPECRVVALGASTGGPGALVTILQGLPEGFPLPVLAVLHINEALGGAFADWLDGQSPHRVRFARDGEPLAAAAGEVRLAPPDRHLLLRAGRLRLTADPERHSCRPSVDVLFESLAELGPQAAACLLTGMGPDGAAGLLRIREAGGQTIAQDEASSVVYGMPREAALLGAAERILPLHEIPQVLAALGPVAEGTRP